MASPVVSPVNLLRSQSNHNSGSNEAAKSLPNRPRPHKRAFRYAMLCDSYASGPFSDTNYFRKIMGGRSPPIRRVSGCEASCYLDELCRCRPAGWAPGFKPGSLAGCLGAWVAWVCRVASWLAYGVASWLADLFWD